MDASVNASYRELRALLPHEPPMLLLSGCESETADGIADAWVDISSKSPFFDLSLGGVPGCVALEYMAQTMAICVGRMRRKNGLPPAVGFVLGSRRLCVDTPAFKPGERYRIHAECTYSDEAFGSFSCSVLDADGAVGASGEITAYLDGNAAIDKKE